MFDLQWILNAPNNLAFKIGNLEVQWYGIILTSAMILGLILLIFYGKARGYSSDDMITLFLWVVPMAVVFSRIVYVIVRPDPSDGYWPVTSFGLKQFIETGTAPLHSFINLIAIWEGGITIIGGVIGGILGGLIFCKKHKAPPMELFDLVIPILFLCQGIGRWGNYVNQEAFGVAITNPALQHFPIAVYISNGFYEGWYAATFFYAFVWNVLGALVIFLLTRKSRIKGLSIFMYLVLYCFKRAMLEFIRLDAVVTGGGLYLTQAFMFICVAFGIIGGILYYLHGKNKLEHQRVKEEIDALLKAAEKD